MHTISRLPRPLMSTVRLYTIHAKPPPANVHTAMKAIVANGPFAKFDETIR